MYRRRISTNMKHRTQDLMMFMAFQWLLGSTWLRWDEKSVEECLGFGLWHSRTENPWRVGSEDCPNTKGVELCQCFLLFKDSKDGGILDVIHWRITFHCSNYKLSICWKATSLSRENRAAMFFLVVWFGACGRSMMARQRGTDYCLLCLLFFCEVMDCATQSRTFALQKSSGEGRACQASKRTWRRSWRCRKQGAPLQ